MYQEILSELSEPGVLRVGVNLGNILLVTGTSANGDPEGVSPDMGAAIADMLGVAVRYVTRPTPGELADAMAEDAWDIALIAFEPERAKTIHFCDAYVEIEATYLVPQDSPLQTIEDVDQPGVRIAVSERAAYDLYLSRTLKHATLHRGKGLPGAFELFKNEKLDALAGLVPALKENATSLPGSRLIPGRYTSVRQAIGTKPENKALIKFLEGFVAEAKSDGFVAELLKKHGVQDKLQVASTGN